MSQFSGKQARGAMRQRKLDKRAQANERNTAYQARKEAENADNSTGGRSEDSETA